VLIALCPYLEQVCSLRKRASLKWWSDSWGRCSTTTAWTACWVRDPCLRVLGLPTRAARLQRGPADLSRMFPRQKALRMMTLIGARQHASLLGPWASLRCCAPQPLSPAWM
jgi:hypothetical protein